MGFPSSSLVRTTECAPDDGREMEYAFHAPTPALNSPLRDANKTRTMRSQHCIHFKISAVVCTYTICVHCQSHETPISENTGAFE